MGQDGKAFRAQLAVPEQRQLYDYWLERAQGSSMPCRGDISPTHIPRMLPGVSLVEVTKDIIKSRVRLAGTRLRDIFEREITGLCLCDLEWADKHDYWMAAFERTIKKGVPTQGIVRGPRVHKEHLVQYWLRLPLRTTGSGVGMVLCYDHFLTSSDRLESGLAETA